jgi:hypothetical protein
MAADAGIGSHNRVRHRMLEHPGHDYAGLDAEPNGRHEADAASRGLRHSLDFIT